MPPSGYSSAQSDAIATFLNSCASALKAESVSLSRSPVQGLEKECTGIEGLLATGSPDLFAQSILELTKAFYQRVLDMRPADFEAFDASVRKALDEVAQSILAIHVPDESLSVIA